MSARQGLREAVRQLRQPSAVPVVVATYRDPAVVEAESVAERTATRTTRWRTHRVSLLLFAYHVGMLGWCAHIAFAMGQTGRWSISVLCVALAGGINGSVAGWAWMRAKRSFS